jgi:hypothetical protein
MSQTTHRLALRQGNATVRRLMIEALEEAGFVVDHEPGDEELASLLIVDVDSDLDDVEALSAAYAERDLPVLVSGVRSSRERFPEADWLERPFSRAGLLAQCREMLGLAAAASSEPAASPEQIDPLVDEDASDTKKLSQEDAEELERRLGLEEGSLTTSSEDEEDDDSKASVVDTGNLSVEEAESFLELDVEDIEELDELDESAHAGGELVGEVERRRLDSEELDWQEPASQAPTAPQRSTLNQTMPDAPAAIAPSDGRPGRSEETPVARPSLDRASSAGSGLRVPPELDGHLTQVSDLLAESWNRIGLAARRRDRAEHIARVLRAGVAEGIATAQAEIERIPGARGFSGSLSVLGLAELLETLQRQQLRGRLEISSPDDDFVLYVDRDRLDDIENLAGGDDQMLLEALRDTDALSEAAFAELDASLSDEMAAPLQMRLRQQDLASVDQIRRARRVRARRLFAGLASSAEGSFAFMEVEHDSGHAWPVDGLQVELEALLEEATRQDSEGRAALSSEGKSASDAPEGLDLDELLPATVEVGGAEELDDDDL